MRALLFAAYFLIAYYALRAVLRWLFQTPQSAAGDVASEGEMVLDPECRVYVLKERAVTRRIQGRVICFCSEDCAEAHAARS